MERLAVERQPYPCGRDVVRRYDKESLLWQSSLVGSRLMRRRRILLGAERLFANAPTVEIGEVSVVDGESAGTAAMSIAVTVKDGESVVAVNAAKVRAMFEATGDLGDWNGAAKLTPEVVVEDGEGATMRFKVTPGDGTAPRAFLRIRK